MPRWWVGVAGWSPSGPTVCVLGTPELLYTETGTFTLRKVVDSRSGTLVAGYGGLSSSSPPVVEFDLDGNVLGTVFTSTFPPYYGIATDPDGNIYTLDNNNDAWQIRKNGASWANISAYSASYNTLSHLAVNPDDGTVWFTDYTKNLYEVSADGSTVTQHAAPSGTPAFAGMVWLDGTLYIVRRFTGDIWTYSTGSGPAYWVTATTWNSDDITYSPLTGRFYMTTVSNNVGAAQPKIISLLTDGTDHIEELDTDDFPSSVFGTEWMLDFAGTALYVVGPSGVSGNRGRLYRIPFECS